MTAAKSRKKEFLHENAEKVLEEMQVPFMETDERGVVIHANRCAQNIHPSDAGDLIGQTIWELMAPDDQEVSREAFYDALKSGEDPMPVQRSFLTDEGQYRTFEIHRSLRRDATGTPIGIRNVGFDITEAITVHKEERNARQWTEMLLNAFTDAVISVDALGVIRTANMAAENLTGWTDGSLTGQVIEKALSIQKYVSPDGATLTHSITLTRPTRGFAVMHNLQQDEITVEIRTYPMQDRFSGILSGVAIVLRTHSDLTS